MAQRQCFALFAGNLCELCVILCHFPQALFLGVKTRNNKSSERLNLFKTFAYFFNLTKWTNN
jgi:hypothetical protein